MTAVEHRDAIIALLNAAPASSSVAAYSLGQLKAMATKPAQYAEVMVMERPAAVERAGGLDAATAWRVVTRAVAKDEANAELVRARVRARLLEATVTVGGTASTAIRSPVADNPITPDDTWFSGASEFSYYL